MEALVAGTMAIEFIEHKTSIQLNEPGTTMVEKEQIKGEITF